MVRKSIQRPLPGAAVALASTTSYPRRSLVNPPSIDDLPIPGQFQVKRELGRGGMGAVYLAYDRRAGHDVALKLLYGFGADDRLRLKQEFRSLSGIVHPNLVNLYELVMDENVCFFTMEYVRGSDLATCGKYILSTCDDPAERYERFRPLALQLALAVNALHEGGVLHRDIKPSNVLVTESGRVVLLDFGLACSAASSKGVSEEDRQAGTMLYMSPEQRWGGALTTASDWFSYAMTLREALTGVPPARREILLGQSSKSLRERGIDIPKPLDQLITRLLESDPKKRPASSEVLLCLGGNVERHSFRPASGSHGERLPLVGREPLLARLRQALQQSSTDRRPRVVRLSGPSGIGKSALMHAFFEEQRAASGALLLKSRCHPKETLVFNALDGVADELGRELREGNVPPVALQADQIDALAQVFPVLAQAICGDETTGPLYVSDLEKRQAATAAIRDILRAAARSRPILLWLDDVHWGDADSGRLLRSLLVDPSCPPLLLVLSYREEGEATSPCLNELKRAEAAWEQSTILPVGPLDAQQSAELLRSAVGESLAGDAAAREDLVRWAAGSPFFLTELARYLKRQIAPDQPVLTGREIGIEDLLSFRLRGLSPAARTVLEVLATAGAPLELEAMLSAAKLDAHHRGLIADLEKLSIVRTLEMDRRRIEFYHDKLREEVMRILPDEARVAHHLAIGRALLETTAPNPLAAIEHFEAAGDVPSVRRYVLPAANHAVKLLAFERAARLYRRAIELEPGEVPLHELYRRLGSALGSAGLGKEAGVAFSTAARLLRLQPGSPEESTRLQQSAAEQFIQTGHFQEGVEMIREVLAELDVPFPKSRGEALTKATALRLAAMVRSLQPRARQDPPSSLELARFDALWAANARLAMVDYALCNYATIRSVYDALALAEPSRMCRALGMEAAYCSTLPQAVFQRRSRALMFRAAELAQDERASAADRTFIKSIRAITSFYFGRFRETWQLADECLSELPPGRSWERNPWTMWSLIGLALNGELAELIERVQALREEAIALDDRHIEQNISLGAPALAWLALDQPEDALRAADRALSGAPSNYTIQHYEHYVTTVDCDLYLNDGLSAWRRTVQTWPSHRQEFFLSLTFVRDDLLRTRARAALAAALALRFTGRARTDDDCSPERLLKIASRAARAMRRHGLDSARGFAALADAGIAKVEGQLSRAFDYLSEASSAFERADMKLHRQVARYCMDGLRSTSGSDAEAWLRGQGVVRPDRLVATIAPGLGPLDAV